VVDTEVAKKARASVAGAVTRAAKYLSECAKKGGKQWGAATKRFPRTAARVFTRPKNKKYDPGEEDSDDSFCEEIDPKRAAQQVEAN